MANVGRVSGAFPEVDSQRKAVVFRLVLRTALVRLESSARVVGCDLSPSTSELETIFPRQARKKATGLAPFSTLARNTPVDNRSRLFQVPNEKASLFQTRQRLRTTVD